MAGAVGIVRRLESRFPAVSGSQGCQTGPGYAEGPGAERVVAIQGRRPLGDVIKALGEGSKPMYYTCSRWHATAIRGEAGAADRNGRDGVASRNRAIGDAGPQR